VPVFVMRVWLADRPGALGSVAARIGSVGGDVTGIDILERGGDRVIDELTVDLPNEDLISELLESLKELEFVDVEDIRAVVAGLPYPLIDALEVSADLITGHSVADLFEVLVAGVGGVFSGWAAVVDPEGPVVLSASVDAPTPAWLEAFVTGTSAASEISGRAGAANDVAWAGLEVSGLALLVGRSGRPFRSRERRQLATLARIADQRWRELVVRDGKRAHPARST
jgi:hypothetical protein